MIHQRPRHHYNASHVPSRTPRVSRLDRPGAAKPIPAHHDPFRHSLPAHTSQLQRTTLTPAIRFQRGLWLFGGRP